jgi:hypothetical protein
MHQHAFVHTAQVGYYLDTANSTKLLRVVVDTATGKVGRWGVAAGAARGGRAALLHAASFCAVKERPGAISCLCLAPPQVTRQLLGQRGCEFPSINPNLTARPHTHIYTTAGVAGGLQPPAGAFASRPRRRGKALLLRPAAVPTKHNPARPPADSPDMFSPPQALWKLSVDPALGTGPNLPLTGPKAGVPAEGILGSQLWEGAADQAVQEPVFVPRPGGTAEDDGWVLAMLFDAGRMRSELAVFDARDIAQGPVARVKLEHHVPLGLHGSFTREQLLPRDQAYMAAPQRFDIRQGV